MRVVFKQTATNQYAVFAEDNIGQTHIGDFTAVQPLDSMHLRVVMLDVKNKVHKHKHRRRRKGK